MSFEAIALSKLSMADFELGNLNLKNLIYSSVFQIKEMKIERT